MPRSDETLLQLDALDPDLTTGLILCGMGGPDGPDAVAPFLRNLFSDPAILPLPNPLRRFVSFMIVRKRATEVQARYASLGFGGGSPQLEWTSRQCDRLAELMSDLGLHVVAKPAMRYWHPFPQETVAALLQQGARQFIVVPAYPQFAAATSGSTLRAVKQAITAASPDASIHCLGDWHLLPGYINALERHAAPVLRGWADEGIPAEHCALLPVAHSLPERFIRNGDPYLDQTNSTVALLRKRVKTRLAGMGDWWNRLPGGGIPLLAFQSKLGPVRWLGPNSESEVRRLATEGCRRILVLPISFTCEHIETLHELDVDLAETARAAGIREYVRAPALGMDEPWLDSLANCLSATAFGASDKRRNSHQQESCYA